MNGENELGKIASWHFTVILGVILHKESIEKKDRNLGEEALDLIQASDWLIKKGLVVWPWNTRNIPTNW